MKLSALLAANLQHLMSERGLKQRHIGGVPLQTIVSRALRSKGCTLTTLDKIGEALEVDPLSLLDRRPERVLRLFARLTKKQQREVLRGMVRTAWENRALARELEGIRKQRTRKQRTKT